MAGEDALDLGLRERRGAHARDVGLDLGELVAAALQALGADLEGAAQLLDALEGDLEVAAGRQLGVELDADVGGAVGRRDEDLGVAFVHAVEVGAGDRVVARVEVRLGEARVRHPDIGGEERIQCVL